MSKKKHKKSDKSNQLKEPYTSYVSRDGSKTITFFSSFEEENKFVAKERFLLSYDQRMLYAEELRKNIFNKYIFPDGKWMPVEKTFIIMPPHVDKIS